MFCLIGMSLAGHKATVTQPYSIGELIPAYRVLKNMGFRKIIFGGRI